MNPSMPNLVRQSQTASQFLEEKDPTLTRYEVAMGQLRRLIEQEKKNSFHVKTIYAQEMESKQELLRVMRLSIEDVREEIRKKKAETSKSYRATTKQKLLGSPSVDAGLPTEEDEDPERQMTEKERLLEILLSQERVLTLVYMHLRGGYCQAIRPQELDAGPSQLSEQPAQLPSRSQYMASRLSSQRKKFV